MLGLRSNITGISGNKSTSINKEQAVIHTALRGHMGKFYRYVLFIFFLISQFTSIQAQMEGHAKGTGTATTSPDPTTGLLEGGYVSTLNVYQGEKISFYVSTHESPFTLKVYRYGKEKKLVREFTGLIGGVKNVRETDSVWVKGCNWDPVVKDFEIPADWKAGAYVAEFPVNSDKVTPIVFFVKEKNPANRSRILVAASTNTYQAYNMFGGKSIYDEFSTNHDRAVKLSFHRPFNKNNHHEVNRGSFESYDAKLVYWL